MNLIAIIERVNKFRPNALTEQEIVSLVDELEADIVLNLYNEAEYLPLTMSDISKELKAPIQFGKIYYEYLEARIDKVNGQMENYAASVDQFNGTYAELGAYVTRNNLRVIRSENRFNSYF